MGSEADFYEYRTKLRHYERAGPEVRIQYILRHYTSMQRIVGDYENKMKIAIQEEAAFNIRKSRGEPGERVQTGFWSDPTMEQAMRGLEMDQTFQRGDIQTLLRHVDQPNQHIQDWNIVKDMKFDCAQIREALHILKPEEEDLFIDYLNGKRTVDSIADEYRIQYQLAKNKIARIRIKVIRSAAQTLMIRYGRNRREWLWDLK